MSGSLSARRSARKLPGWLRAPTAIFVGVCIATGVAAVPAQATPIPPPCSSGYVALTFDDGPGPGTAALLDILAQHNAKATFFLIGQNAQNNPDAVHSIGTAGHQIGNHTFTHVSLDVVSTTVAQEELQKTQDLLTAQTGTTPIFMRPPHTRDQPADAAVYASLGLTRVSTNLDNYDWSDISTQESIDRVLGPVKNGDIILSHAELHPNGLAGIAATLDGLAERGLCTGTLLPAAQVNPQTNSAVTVGDQAGNIPPPPNPVSLPAPTGLTVTANAATTATLTWSPVTGASGYSIYNNGAYLGWSTSTTYTVTGLAGAPNTIQVVAANGVTHSAKSSGVAVGIPGPPTGVAVTANTATSATISWKAVPGASGYSIYNNGAYLGWSDNPSYTINPLPSGPNWVHLVAVNSAGYSAKSAGIAVGPAVAAPVTPTGVSVTANSPTQATLAWTAVAGADGYSIYNNGSYLGWSSSATYTVTGLGTGSNWIQIVAANAAGYSAKSTGVPVGASAVVPETPTGLAVTSSTASSATLAWNPVTGAEGYSIYDNGGYIGWSDTPTYTVTGLATGSNWIQVLAANAAGYSAKSNGVIATGG
ncbi:MAG: polysaccharide deacetylase family protein [Actinomycetes bacterium]